VDLSLYLIIAGVLGALVDLALHVLQLWPRFVPSQRFVNWLTFGSGTLILASCITAPNAAAITMGSVVIGMSLFAMFTGKEVHA
jgi:hypothetical protein